MSEYEDEAEKIAAARQRLEAAVKAYYAETQPDVFIDGWVLATHKRTAEMEQRNEAAIGVISGADQSPALTVGILNLAYKGRRNNFFSD